MREAWQYENSPFLYGIARRIEMTRYVLFQKFFHRDAFRLARLRALWLILCGHETEICCFCGGKVGVVWWCESEALWTELTGWDGGGIACIRCFDHLAEQRGILIRWLAREDCRREAWRVYAVHPKQLSESKWHDA